MAGEPKREFSDLFRKVREGYIEPQSADNGEERARQGRDRDAERGVGKNSELKGRSRAGSYGVRDGVRRRGGWECRLVRLL